MTDLSENSIRKDKNSLHFRKCARAAISNCKSLSDFAGLDEIIMAFIACFSKETKELLFLSEISLVLIVVYFPFGYR